MILPKMKKRMKNLKISTIAGNRIFDILKT